MKNIKIVHKMIGTAIIIMMVLCTLSIKSYTQVSNTTVSVTCASGAVAKKIEVKVYKVDANGNAINPCKCLGPKCETNEAKKESTDNSGNANFSGKTGLDKNTNYIATVNTSCLAQAKCNKLPEKNCHFNPGNSSEVFITNANGGVDNPVLLFNGACRSVLDEASSDIPQGKLSIYPNPAQQKVTFNVNDYHGRVQLQVVNVQGLQVISKYIVLNGKEIYSLDISSLEKGIYKVVLSNGLDIKSGTFVKE